MKLEEKEKAIKLREIGYSLKEISGNLNVAKSSVSLWVRDIVLSSTAQKRLLSKIKLGQYNAAEKKKKATRVLNEQLLRENAEYLQLISLPDEAEKLLCAMIYWCEGAKNYKDGVAFTNSDPKLVRLFIDLFVKHFQADRSKIVARLHLHEYHHISLQHKFWSRMLNIPLQQFRKPYMKPHTKKRIRDGYSGCIALRYHNSIMARKLLYLAQAYLNKGV